MEISWIKLRDCILLASFHQQDEKGERHPNRSEDEERVEIGERGGWLLTSSR
jgi:hypothetical protein